MPQSRSPSGSSRGGGGSSASKRSSAKRSASAARRSNRGSGGGRRTTGVSDGIAGVVELLVNQVLKPFDMVLLTRDRIQETLDEAAERGRVTRSDANELVAELFRRGRDQTEDVVRRLRRSEPLDQIVRVADRARRSVGAGSSFPITGYDQLTASQVVGNLAQLSPAELRRVRDYEARHANRKSVLDAIEKALR